MVCVLLKRPPFPNVHALPLPNGSSAAPSQLFTSQIFKGLSSSPNPPRLLDEAWSVYEWMMEDGLWPDRSTYSRLISVRCTRGQLLRKRVPAAVMD